MFFPPQTVEYMRTHTQTCQRMSYVVSSVKNAENKLIMICISQAICLPEDVKCWINTSGVHDIITVIWACEANNAMHLQKQLKLVWGFFPYSGEHTFLFLQKCLQNVFPFHIQNPSLSQERVKWREIALTTNHIHPRSPTHRSHSFPYSRDGETGRCTSPFTTLS